MSPCLKRNVNQPYKLRHGQRALQSQCNEAKEPYENVRSAEYKHQNRKEDTNINEKTTIIMIPCIPTYNLQGTRYVASRSSTARSPKVGKTRQGSQDLSEGDRERRCTTTPAKTGQPSLMVCGNNLLGTESSEGTAPRARTHSALRARRSIE